MQIVSILGALLVLVAFAGHQLQRLDAQTISYQLMNLSGGFVLLVAAMQSGQAGLIVMEGAWTLISGYGLWKVVAGGEQPGPSDA